MSQIIAEPEGYSKDYENSVMHRIVWIIYLLMGFSGLVTVVHRVSPAYLWKMLHLSNHREFDMFEIIFKDSVF